MPAIRILTEPELRKLVPLDTAAVACVENAFAALAGGAVVMPPILSMAIAEHHGEVDVKTAYVPGLDCFAIKISPGFFDNPKLGLPSTSGLMILFSSTTGQLRALLLDNGYLTDVRTAAAGAVAARHLSREDAQAVAVLGTGLQARMQLTALTLVRPIRRAAIWGRSAEKAAVMAREMGERLGIETRSEARVNAAVEAADIIVTTTPSTEPILTAAALRPGQHVTAMGSDQHGKNELDPACLTRARYVADRLSQTRELGELRAAIEAGVVDADADFPELGQIITGAVAGRTSDDEITIADLTGTGVQDTAIATYARERADAAGAGTQFES
jgi:ornithine cyclodeaminase